MESKDKNKNSTDLTGTILQPSPISKLPDECLTCIFSLLPIPDRIRISKVCKRWHSVSSMSWNSLKTLSFNRKDWGVYRHERITRHMLISALQLWGASVICIDFSDYCPRHYGGPNSYRNLLRQFIDLCPNLKIVRLAEDEYGPIEHGEKSLISNLGHSDYCGKVISCLFRNNQYLRGIHFFIPALRDKCWEDFNLDLKKINLLARFVNLSMFEIQDVFSNINDFLEAISPHGEKLDTITIHYTYNLGNLHLKHFEHFKNLQELTLRGQLVHIDVNFFDTCVKHCTKLRKVKLQDLAVTDIEVRKIIILPELRELHLAELSEITDAVFLNGLPSLAELYCYRCPWIKNAGLRELLHGSARNLKILEIHRCENVNISRIVQDAKEGTETNARRYGPLLRISLTGMHISPGDEIKTWISRYLQLNIKAYFNYSRWF